MGILSFNVNTTGLAGDQVAPRRNTMVTTDNLATITAAGYINNYNSSGNPVLPTDVFDIIYAFNPQTQVGSYDIFQVLYSSATGFTLSNATSGSITIPTIVNHLIVATNTTGTLANLTGTAINNGSIQAGLGTGISGSFVSYPGTSAKGSLALTAINNGANYANVISNASTGQATTWSLPDPGAATANVIISASAGTQHITAGGLEIDAGAISSGLATGGFVGKVVLYPTTTTKGSLTWQATANSGNTATIFTTAAYGQASTITYPDPAGATANGVLAPAALVSGNLISASGTAGLIQNSGVTAASVSGAVTQLGTLYQTSVTLNTAAVAAAYATPAQIVANPLASQMILVLSAQVYTASTGNTPYATGTAPIIQYSSGGTNGANGTGIIATAAGLADGDITAATSQVRNLFQFATGAQTGLSGLGIYFSNATGAYTGGTGTNITISLTYVLLTATV